ncbi:SPOR domain-containing protein [Labilibacter marinus]|uniref:SPOR domain-containing protein n=1 Tax=Labilibacter marinus TaxID=1477105 RepID=UPI0008304926|nr:SPOR domain-containing protein [Labilibacter marinus]
MRILLLNLLAIVLGSLSLQAQESSVLSSGDKNKVERADRKINKAQSIVDKKEKYADKIKAAEESGSKRRLRRYETKSNRIIITSASYFKEGYTKKYKAYKKASTKAVKSGQVGSEANVLMTEAKGDYDFGRKMRRKSSNESDVNTAVEYMFDANKSQGNAIDNLIKALGNVNQSEELVEPIEEQEEMVAEEELTMENDSLIGQPEVPLAPITAVTAAVLLTDSVAHQADSLVVDSLTTDTLAMDTLAVIADSTLTITDTVSVVPVVITEELVEEKEVANLYFSVQFLAEKQLVPKDRLNSLYDGPFEVVKHQADGWFRYSFGRFKTLEEANQMKERSGMEGYVVAYLNEERISTRRAAEMAKAANDQ